MNELKQSKTKIRSKIASRSRTVVTFMHVCPEAGETKVVASLPKHCGSCCTGFLAIVAERLGRHAKAAKGVCL